MKVLVFDGDCTLCNRLVSNLVKWNRNPDFYITDFDSEWAQANVPTLVGRSSVIFVDQDYYRNSSAVIRALDAMNHIFIPFKLLLWIPDVLRDDLYKWVARNRNKLIADQTGTQACPAPSEKFKAMYLD